VSVDYAFGFVHGAFVMYAAIVLYRLWLKGPRR
jgi:hypothetical protein